MIKGWLMTAMEKEIRNSVKYAKTATEIWNDLKERFGKESAPKAYELKQSLATTRQDGTTVSAYYTRLRVLWDEMESILPTPRCTCDGCECGLGKKLTELKGKERTYEFLMSLDDHECGREGYNKSGCFKIIGYPEWWQGKGKGDKSKPKAAMVEMKPCPIPGITEEQYAMFLKLFGENREEPVIANMARNTSVNDNWVVDSGSKSGELDWSGFICFWLLLLFTVLKTVFWGDFIDIAADFELDRERVWNGFDRVTGLIFLGFNCVHGLDFDWI
nr:hypothetical protein [Tanacetum cinerariifolium]